MTTVSVNDVVIGSDIGLTQSAAVWSLASADFPGFSLSRPAKSGHGSAHAGEQNLNPRYVGHIASLFKEYSSCNHLHLDSAVRY